MVALKDWGRGKYGIERISGLTVGEFRGSLTVGESRLAIGTQMLSIIIIEMEPSFTF